jgi:hypothetical protein
VVAKVPLLRMEFVGRSNDMRGFAVLPRRWVVLLLVRTKPASRQGLRDLAETWATFVTLASIQFALRGACQGLGRKRKPPFAVYDDQDLQKDAEETFT